MHPFGQRPSNGAQNQPGSNSAECVHHDHSIGTVMENQKLVCLVPRLLR
jgi:hypothetical protein